MAVKISYVLKIQKVCFKKLHTQLPIHTSLVYTYQPILHNCVEINSTVICISFKHATTSWVDLLLYFCHSEVVAHTCNYVNVDRVAC